MASVSSLPRATVQLVADAAPPVEVPNPMLNRESTPPALHPAPHSLNLGFKA